MASVFAHAVFALAANQAFPAPQRVAKIAAIGMFCAVLPDADVIAFSFGIPYRHVLGHRGITHSLAFAALLAPLLAWLCQPREKLWDRSGILLSIYFFIATASHGLLDAMTTGGAGVAFFAPFENGRHFLPWRFIQVSPIGAGNFFSEWGLRVLKSEFVWVMLPSFIFALVAYAWRRIRPQA